MSSETFRPNKKFHKDPTIRKAWTLAVRRKDLEPNDTTVLCSCHFKPEDFDSTGQIVHLWEHVIPSIFASFPDHLKKVPNKARSTRTSIKAGDASSDPVPMPESIELLNSSASDHHYALDPDQLKCKIAEAEARVKELQRRLRNAKDRERRQKRTVTLLLDDL